MKEIKFRAQVLPLHEKAITAFRTNLNKGELVYGEPHLKHIIPHMHTTEGRYAIRPETVGQYTNRKDKHGVEIYEGDIVKTKCNVGVVRYNAKQWLYEVASPDESLDNERIPAGIPEEDWEVLGNIFDSSELLDMVGYYETTEEEKND